MESLFPCSRVSPVNLPFGVRFPHTQHTAVHLYSCTLLRDPPQDLTEAHSTLTSLVMTSKTL